MSDKNPRQIAARILSQRLSSSEYTENLLETALATARLSPADRGLCHELVCGVVRWQGTLDCLIARRTDPARAQRPALVNLLRLGLYQIFWLDRIPPHAAVHETVELAKRSGYASQAGFINAVLRGYLRESDEIKKILADMKVSKPALGWSHPEWLVEKWIKRYGDEKTRQLLEWNNTPPKTFARVNALKLSSSRSNEAQTQKPESEKRENGNSQSLLTSAATEEKDSSSLITRWREENVEYDFVRRDWLDENQMFELKSHPPLSSLGSFRDGWFYIQDPSTLLAARELAAQPGETILDLCAAPGGKTTFIAQQMRNEGKIYACDVSDDRLKLIRDNSKRLGVTNVVTGLASGLHFQPITFDRVLIDAPCSNTGVMRRRVDLRWRIKVEEIERLRTTQLELLDLAAPKLKSGGTLVYSTCSLEPDENADVVAEFLRAHGDFKLKHQRELLPFNDGVDGAFVAVLVKNG